MEWGTPVSWGWFLLFSRSGGHKTKETYPTRPGSPTPCKQDLKVELKSISEMVVLTIAALVTIADCRRDFLFVGII